ncbi:MAG: hypothetical protein R3A52_26675 [Polyangiales bacterium]
MSDAPDRALDVAEEVSDLLASRGARSVIIGAAAMAVHGYARATRDLDLAVVGVPLPTLREVASELRARGYEVSLGEPDAADPLGGVLRVDVDDELRVDVVNFGNPWTGATRSVGEAALDAPSVALKGRRLAVVELVPLVLLKLAAGSRFDLRDAAELLALHPEVDRAALRERCVALRLDKGFDRVMADLDQDR